MSLQVSACKHGHFAAHPILLRNLLILFLTTRGRKRFVSEGDGGLIKQ